MSSRRIPPGLGWCHPRRCQCRGRCTRALSSNRRTRGRWRHCRGGGCTWGEEERMYKPILVLIGSCTLGGGESSSTCISTCISMRQYTAAAQKYRGVTTKRTTHLSPLVSSALSLRTFRCRPRCSSSRPARHSIRSPPPWRGAYHGQRYRAGARTLPHCLFNRLF